MATSILIDDVAMCQAATAELLKESEVAIDLEGVALGRHPGRICILQAVGKENSSVTYLFDITVLKDEAFEAGGLREVLESPTVQKILYDVRSDTDALFHNHHVKVENVFDLQVLYCLKFFPDASNVPGLRTAFAQFGKTQLTATEMQTLEEIKENGKQLFAPERGGSFEVFENRPLDQKIVKYCAADVKYLLAMKQLWSETELDLHVVKATEERMMAFIAAEVIVQDTKKKVDFRVPAGLKPQLPPGSVEETMKIPFGKVGRVIGKGGATIKRIESSSGAEISIDNKKSEARVRGKPSEVRSAKIQIAQACA